jgi:hypothetical protein
LNLFYFGVAIRETLEEAGILLCSTTMAPKGSISGVVKKWRERVNGDPNLFELMLSELGFRCSVFVTIQRQLWPESHQLTFLYLYATPSLALT